MNKRRYERHATVAQATLFLPGVAKLAGEIRNFCEGGVLLWLAGGGPALETVSALSVREVEIRLTADAHSFQLAGLISHVSPQGVGLAFREPVSAAAAVRALHRDTAARSRAQHASGHGEAEAIRRRCEQDLQMIVRPVLDAFFADIRQPLIKAADKAPSNAAQAEFFDALTLLEQSRGDIERRFLGQIDHPEAGAPQYLDASGRVAAERGGLSLVDKVSFDDWLSLAEEQTRLEHRYESSLVTLSDRLGLAWDASVPGQRHPLGPAVLLEAFRVGLNGLDFSVPARRVIYAAFARALVPQLANLYVGLLERTSALASTIQPRAVHRASAHAPEQPAAPVVPERVAESQHEKSTPQPYTPAPAVPAKHNPGPLDAASLLMTLTAPAQGGVAPQAVQQAPAGAVSPAALQAALREIQHRKLAQQVDYLAPHVLETELSQALAASGQAGLQPNDENKQAMDVLGALLDNTLKEESLAADIKRYLQVLQIPLLEGALATPGLMHMETHPARDVLNVLDHFSLAADDRGEIKWPQLKHALDEITQRIARESAGRPDVLISARAELEKLAEPLIKARDLRLERLRETCAARQRTEDSHRAVERAIDARLGGKYVARVLPELLEAGWRRWLILAALRHGVESGEWRRAIQVVDQLQIWLDRDHPRERLPASDVHRLLDYIDEQLVYVCPDQVKQNHIIEVLADLLLGVGEAGERAEPEWVFIPVPPKSAEPEPEEDAIVRRFRVGDWFKFALTPDSWTPAQLTWMDGNPRRCVFVNRRGAKVLELTAGELSRYLQENKAVESDSLDAPLMERTTGALIQSMQDKLRYQATHDPITGLANRKEFIRRLERTQMDGAGMNAQATLGLVDIAQFRVINNLCGMEAGDRLLRETGELIGAHLGAHVPLARMGDHAFGFWLSGVDRREGQAQAESLLGVLSDFHFRWGEHNFAPGAHIGLAAFVPPGSIHTVLKQADAAFVTAKEQGHNNIHSYAEDDAALKVQAQQLDWAGRIDRLLAEDSLFVRCQLIAPVFPERDSHSHYEILLGLRDEEGRVVPPYDFVVAAERWKRMPEIDRWQVHSAFEWIRRNRAQFDAVGGFSINLSGQSLTSLSFLEFLQGELLAADWPLGKITFEVTETAAIGEFGEAVKFIRQIRRYGCKFSLDDFGSGSSSYGYLKNLHVDYLKIDGSFVKDLADSPIDYAMVKSMNEIGHSLGMKTIAEYVESEAILEKLREIGVDYSQGYHTGQPRPLAELTVS
ncbi:DUF1631 family protein [Methylococcus sp. EFPC2]|uniref:DUF1631 family protein n=1 Tax=Methylococcus sp. EFPC2 TaxID=2812648 RepID=UPI0019678FFF|nr:DUF1631 family protein [Methylococcus sp. EFPC2]QSA95974.1 DUF1631 family protein [Methylococcus sp. EFPC2]